uniref:Mur ligase domain-containing protein n=1 Tax=Elioraea sp. TaxID=2185103 RepID=UPI003F6FE83C
MTALWSAAEIAAATGGTALAPFTATGVAIDTRTLEPGDLFVALRGEARDGHRFVAEAMRKGAAGALVSHLPTERPANPTLVTVADTEVALTDLGRAGRARATAQVIAVTGSVGKTGTKEALRHVLLSQGPTHAAAA